VKKEGTSQYRTVWHRAICTKAFSIEIKGRLSKKILCLARKDIDNAIGDSNQKEWPHSENMDAGKTEKKTYCLPELQKCLAYLNIHDD
jgi:hypothetical protein